jgi:hypothetical protein
MADKERLNFLTAIEQDVQIERHAMETYVNWLQKTMSASPWTNVDLNKKLLSHGLHPVPKTPIALRSSQLGNHHGKL